MVGKFAINDLHSQLHPLNDHPVVLAQTVDHIWLGRLLELLSIDLITRRLQTVRVGHHNRTGHLRWRVLLDLVLSLNLGDCVG
jgi:hypothetical protein